MAALSGFSEMTTHDFNVALNEVGKAFLLLEDYYENGRDGSDVPDPFERTVEDFDYPFDDEEPPGDNDAPLVDDKDVPF